MVQELFGLKGRRVLVVGGGQGMGEATALLLASLGADLAILDFELDRAERVCAEVRKQGISAYALSADVTDEAQVVEAVAEVEREFGPIYGLVNIVGMAGWAPLIEMTSETWDRDHSRNLRYVFLMAREVAKGMLARGSGRIVCLSSIDGIRSASHHGAYGAAKAGLVHLVKTMAAEWSQHGVRVNCVAPGAIVTPRIPLRSVEEERELIAPYVPMSRRGSVADIGKAVTFFLSDMSDYVTGQTLAVDGGFLATGGFGPPPVLEGQGTLGLK
ncbi:MAG: SDR family NAD(P)-dependent oxidoreductase [Parasphingorhabdus sp.]